MTDKKFEQFCSLYFQAEKKLKKIETVIGRLAIPPLNEFRYAGCHIARYLSGEEESNISDAERHCKRAIYDSMEIGISYYLDEIGNFREDYKLIPITDVVNGYVEDCQKIREIQNFISSYNRHQLENSWEVVQANFDVLEKINDKLEAARPELNKKILNWRRNIAIGLGCFVVTVISILIAM